MKIVIMVFVLAWFSALGSGHVVNMAKPEPIMEDIVLTDVFREQKLDEVMIENIRKSKDVGEEAGLFLLKEHLGYGKSVKHLDGYDHYAKTMRMIWNDVKYFPVAEITFPAEWNVSFTDSWMSERTYGGKRGHEGTDIIASKNQRGVYPIVSMTDGMIEQKGWLEKGGYRVGVRAPSGAYFYYAHLESYADIQEGDEIKAGDILGYMGDTGYGEEGTKGQFAVHLHLGIYIMEKEKEISVNPYWVLRYIENKKLKCYTEV